jgi:hypothetical protein
LAGFFPVQYAGVSMYDAMYDYEVLTQAWQKYCDDFAPDACNAPTTVVPGRPLEILYFQLCKWPGQGVSKHQEYQYVEKEYMKIEVDDSKDECLIKSAIFENPEKIVNVCHWMDQCRLIDESDQWTIVK